MAHDNDLALNIEPATTQRGSRTVYTVEEAAKNAKQAEKDKLVADLREFVGQAHQWVRGEAQDVLDGIDTWSVMELTPMLRKLKNYDRWCKTWAKLSPSDREKAAHAAYRALYNMPMPGRVDVKA